jgi:hypothetical protein
LSLQCNQCSPLPQSKRPNCDGDRCSELPQVIADVVALVAETGPVSPPEVVADGALTLSVSLTVRLASAAGTMLLFIKRLPVITWFAP